MACNENCITLEQLYNLLDTYDFASASIPVGARLTIGLNTYNTFFDSASGLGSDEWEGWAISNGNNNTTNRLGKFCVYHDPSDTTFNTIDSTGGQKTNQLTTSELPVHTHAHGLASHTHTINDTGHSHTISSNSQLASTSIGLGGSGTYSVNSSGYAVALAKQQIRIEDSVAPSNPKDIEVYVPSVNKQAYAGLTDGSDNLSLTGSGSITVPGHTHSASLGHSHTNTASTSTTGVSIQANVAETVGGTTQSAGSGQSFTNLPPYIVEVPVEKIA